MCNKKKAIPKSYNSTCKLQYDYTHTYISHTVLYPHVHYYIHTYPTLYCIHMYTTTYIHTYPTLYCIHMYTTTYIHIPHCTVSTCTLLHTYISQTVLYTHITLSHCTVSTCTLIYTHIPIPHCTVFTCALIYTHIPISHCTVFTCNTNLEHDFEFKSLKKKFLMNKKCDYDRSVRVLVIVCK